VFIFVSVYFVIDSVRKLSDIPSYLRNKLTSRPKDAGDFDNVNGFKGAGPKHKFG